MTFFHKSSNIQMKLNWISSIEWWGIEIFEKGEITKHFKEFFKNLFKPIDIFMNLDQDSLYPSSIDLYRLYSPFTLDEIKKVVFSFKSNKSPGLDTMYFFQYFQDIICSDLFLFTQLCNCNVHLSKINYASQTLLPKKEIAKSPSDFKPITLIHTCIKIFIKIHAKRLQPFMNEPKDPVHITYIKGRSIMDNFLCANEILQHSMKGGIKDIFLKLDFFQNF